VAHEIIVHGEDAWVVDYKNGQIYVAMQSLLDDRALPRDPGTTASRGYLNDRKTGPVEWFEADCVRDQAWNETVVLLPFLSRHGAAWHPDGVPWLVEENSRNGHAAPLHHFRHWRATKRPGN